MSSLRSLSDAELAERLPALVKAERHAMLDVIEHLVEMERRRLYLSFNVGSLYAYCIGHLGYADQPALKRHRVAKLALRFPQVLEELRAGTLNVTGLFLLSSHLTEENAARLLGEARGQSKRRLEQLIAGWFPRADVPSSIQTGRPTYSGVGESAHARLQPLSPARLRVEFTARAELYEKVEKVRELLSHAMPNGDLGELFERALDALIEQETRKRLGAGKPRKARKLKAGSRHVPVAIARAVWERDGAQCTFVDGEGHRCAERRFLTIEHRNPFALGGPPTLENLCLLCSAHNLENGRQVFGEEHVAAKIRERTAVQRPEALSNSQEHAGAGQVLASLCGLGFGRREAAEVIGRALGSRPDLGVEQLLRECLHLLVPRAS